MVCDEIKVQGVSWGVGNNLGGGSGSWPVHTCSFMRGFKPTGESISSFQLTICDLMFID